MGSLFPDDPIDRAALDELAARSVPRAGLSGRFLCLAKSSDMFGHGYIVAHWVIPGVPGSEVLEYLPRFSDLPRVTVATYADQAAVHRALGVRVVGPGRKFREHGHSRRVKA